MANDRNELLDALEAFVCSSVHIGPWTAPDAPLERKLDILERVVELLRLRTGETANQLTMAHLMTNGLTVERGASGHRMVRLAGERSSYSFGPCRPDGFKQSELQVPLLLFLFNEEDPKPAIRHTIDGFVEAIRPHLSPADVETTSSGVTRVVTSTRSCIRALRVHGMITTSQETAYKRWELSVFGLLVAAALSETHSVDRIPGRGLGLSEGGAFGGAMHLSEPVRSVVRRFTDPMAVRQVVWRLCFENADVLASFAKAIELVTRFCTRYYGPEPERLTFDKRRAVSAALLSALKESLPADALAEDVRIDRRLKDLIRRERS